MVRNRHEAPEDNGSRRTNELFNMFMEDLEQNYMKSHTVAFYAGRLNITSKYLNNIVRQMTGYTTKDIIDQYVTMQIKLQLRTADKSVKQLAWDFNFSDESFFCRYFKLHTGYTPQQFRKTSSNNSQATRLTLIHNSRVSMTSRTLTHAVMSLAFLTSHLIRCILALPADSSASEGQEHIRY